MTYPKFMGTNVFKKKKPGATHGNTKTTGIPCIIWCNNYQLSWIVAHHFLNTLQNNQFKHFLIVATSTIKGNSQRAQMMGLKVGRKLLHEGHTKTNDEGQGIRSNTLKPNWRKIDGILLMEMNNTHISQDSLGMSRLKTLSKSLKIVIQYHLKQDIIM